MKENRDNLLKQRLESAWDVPPMKPDARERFLNKLEREERPRGRHKALYISLISTVAAAIIAFAFIVMRPTSTDNPVPTQMDLTIAEVKGYYKAKLWSESEYITMLAEKLDEDTRETLLQEVRKLETGPDSLVEMLQKEPISDDLKIQYITQVYSHHLSSIQQIHSMLQEYMAKK